MENKVIIYNPRNGADIDEIYAKNIWRQKVNTLVKYDQQLADYLLKKYDFLRKVAPKDLKTVQDLINAKYKCEVEGCDYITDDEKKLRMHYLGKHKLSEETKKELESIPDAQPAGEVQTLTSQKGLSPEQLEGIPDTKKGEVSGWYGPGWEQDKVSSGMMKRKQPGVTTGHFN